MKALNYVKMRKLLEELKEEDPTVTVVRDEKGKKVSNTTISPTIPRQERVRQFIEDPTIITNYRTPVKRKVNVIEDDDDDKKWYQELFQAADSFKDKKGNILTDTIGTILGTTADVGLGAVKGIAQVGEEIGGLAGGLIAQGADILGADKYADKVRKNIADGKGHVISNILKKGQDALDDYSVIGDTGDKVTEGVGQLASFYATGGVGMFASGAGGSLEESYQKEDVEDWQVWTKAVGTGAISFATEKLGGFFGKSTSLDNKLANVAAQKMANGMAKIFTRSTIQATAEAGEEALEYAGNQLLDLGIDKFTEATGSNGAKFKEDWDWEAFGEQVAVGFLTSKAASTGLNVSNVASTKAKNNISTKEAINEVAKQQDRAAGMLTKSEQQAIDSIVNERIEEIQKQNTLENELKTAIENRETSQGGILSTKNKNALRKSILTKIENGEIDTSSTKVSKKELSKIKEEVKKNLSEGKYDLSKLEDILTPTETAKIKELEQSLANTKDNTQKAQIQAQIKKLKTSKLSSLKNMVNDNQYLNKAVYETEMSNQKYSYDETTVTDEYEKGTRESAKSYLTNTTVSRNFVDNIAKLAKDRQTNYKFTNNKELLEQGDLVENTNLTKAEKALIQDLEKQLSNATTEAQKRNIQNQIDEIKYYDVGGFVRKNVDGVETVLINVDSKQSLNAVVGHETKHLLEKNSLNKEYNKLLFEYAKTKGDYDTYKKRIERLYEGVDNANIENELSAALTGDYLFTDSKFIETLLNDKNANSPKIIQKIRELIDDLVVRFKGTDQEKQLREVQKKFKELYKQNATEENVAQKETKTQYSLISDNANKTYIQDINKTRAEMMKKQNKSDTEIWLATGYQYNEEIGKWQTEVADPKFKTDTKVEVGKEYRLEDVIDAEELFKAYPQLREVTFERTDFSDIAETQEELEAMRKKVKGSTTQDGKIVINENVKSKKLAGEILTHEIQHLIQEIEGYDTDHSVYFMQDEKGKVYISKEYLNDPTEKEARQVQNRNMMTEDERANIVPKNTSNKVDFNRYSLSNTKVSKQYLERQFKELTGESIQRADAILGGIEVRNNMRKEGNRTDALESIPYSDEAMEIYKTYKNSRKSSNALYHTTSKDNLQSILANGLTTNNQARQEGVSGKGKLYLAADEQLASSFGEDTDILLRIDPKYNLENLESDLLGGEGTYSTTNNIPVSALQVKENGKWVKLEKSQLSKQNTQYSLTDNKGRELSKEQQEHFKDSKVRDVEGNLLTVYHGTRADFNIFDIGRSGENYEGWSNSGRGFYFTDSETEAQSYGKDSLGDADAYLKEVYLNITNPFDTSEGINRDILEIAEEYNIDSDIFENRVKLLSWLNTNKIDSTEVLQKYGYDGIIDYGHYVAFEPNQIKNVDNANPTSNPDIRYSLSDNKGRTLTKEQQEYFKNVVPELKDENGNLKVLYHGSPNQFTQFSYDYIGSNGTALGKGFYLTDSISMAEGFTGNGNKPMELYANITKPMSLEELTISKSEFKKFVSEIAKQDEYWIYDYGDVDREGFNKTLNYAVDLNYDNETNDVDLIHGILNTSTLGWEEGFRVLNKTLGYDGIIKHYEAPIDQATGESNVYVPFFPEQIKNITNQNPTDNPDIRFSLYNQNEDITPVGDYNVYGKDIKYYDLPFEDNISAYRDAFDQSVRESIEGVERELGRRPQDPTKESSYDNPTSAREWKEKAKKRSIEQKVEDTIRKHSYKNAASTSMLGRRLLDFNEHERRTFRDSLLGMTSKTREQLINADTYNNVRNIINQYANREYNFIDEELAAAKRDVRSYRIKLDDYVKNQITDFNDFRKGNFGNLTISKDGMSIDSVWQELSMSYPYYFSEDVTSEADMLYALSDFMQRDITITEKYRLSDNDIEDITKKIYNKIVHNALSQQDLEFAEQDIADQVERRTRQVVQNELLEEMGITDDVLMNAKKISQPDLMRTDPIRVNEKIFGWKNGQIINDATINTTIKHEAERVRFLNQERNEIKSLGIKPRSKESAAVQKYAEKQYVNKFGEVVPYTDKELVAEFKDPKTQVKIKRAAQILRRKYDTYIDIVNNELERMGYDPIPKRKDYMRHFQEMTDIFSRLGTPLNPTSLNEENLPTDINGLTDEFKPGKSWFANAQKRKGMKTVYDAITGIDGYLDSVSNVIYHTEDIQRYRTLSKHIRTMFSDKALEDYDVLRDEDKIEAFNNAYKGQQGYLAQYVAWLDEQANALAGKKGKIDRGIEEVFGRKVYTALNDAKKQVGSNMTGFNVRSAMTNFASAINGMSKTKKIAFAKGTLSTFNNIIKDDGLIDKSNFLTTRFGSEQLSKKAWQKVSNYGQIFMTGSDYFTANQIWRSKYFENIDSGMSESDAIKNADDFAARIMGNRAKGTTAQIFNSKTLGLFTQFQLEVNNQWSSLIHDNQMEIEKGKIEGKTAKATASVIFNLGQLAIFSNLFNTLMTSLTGSDVMIDPIELFKTLTGDDDEEKEKLSTRVTKAVGEVINDLPFASTFTGGRIPISEAFGGVQTLTKKLTGQTDEYGNEYEWSDVWSDMFESGMYWVLPTGYNQMKKTKQGLGMFDDDLPIAGSYTDSGNLRFTVDDSLESKIKAGLFGQWANEEAQEYIDSGFKSIRKNSIQELKDLGMKSSEYRILKSNINASGKTNEDKVNFITDLDELTDSQKNTLVNNILDRDYDVDVSNYDAYSSYEEFDFSYKSPEKYAFLVVNNISYQDYVSSDESKEAYNWAFNNPEKYSVAKTITDDMVEYKRYTSEISDIEADKKEDGTSVRGSRKEKIINYVNSLDLSVAQKAIMIRKEYPSYDDYNNEIVDYVIGLEIDETEKNIILEELDMRVDSEGYVWW